VTRVDRRLTTAAPSAPAILADRIE